MYMMSVQVGSSGLAASLLLIRDNHSVAASLDQKGRLVAGGWLLLEILCIFTVLDKGHLPWHIPTLHHTSASRVQWHHHQIWF